VGTQLPRSDSYCASQVEPMTENVAANDAANHTVPSGSVQWGPWAQRISNFQDVDGNFSGTTGEILEWAACKWGWDQSYAMAEAVVESTWRQSEVSGGSYGILQVKVSANGAAPSANSGWGGYPQIQQSTALDADAQMAYLRACYDGDTTWLGNGYAAGNAWGCIGSWYSGQWLTSAAEGYISRVQAVLSSQGWTNLG
jgi:autotransporter family porin